MKIHVLCAVALLPLASGVPAETRKSADPSSVLSSSYRTCFGPDAPLSAESYGCLDEEYHRLEGVLAFEFRTALSRQTNEAARQHLQRDERRWWRLRFRHCAAEVSDLRGATARVVNESCEIDALAARIITLRNYGR